jgi:serine/threonine-protein kinase HipA
LLSGEARRPKISRTGHFCRQCQIGKRATLAELDAEGWTAFAKDAGISFPLVRRRIAEICENVRSAAEEGAANLLRPGLDEEALAGYADLVRQRAELCALSVQRRST